MHKEHRATPPLTAPDEVVVFIGRIRTPWLTRADCPRNVLRAREAGGSARVEIDPVYRPGLANLSAYSHVILLYWMDEAERDLLVQRPSHADGPRGVFSIRSPARPNPIALSVARVLSLNESTGLLEVEQLDCRDNTALIDVKPYLPTIDSVPGATADR
ncbi:tRNA (N6-threonylcarbamoyladenosine(37)-N6)-methyltransferase TrmO [Chthonobacter albigriseus]|uniref:tRNA (N6-threonylcarbamoyladenosine(37)-N6)-methyltransferase TrmO n=1 Tax=Chthonobacter albigriseus TaxID=1683161 RepID=UPI001FCEDC58|nr:tRNA (N6-threonylcarbamoyladenosine(37)-N6)-methyltransferase TrmO [Chthonobacter albigriseus]